MRTAILFLLGLFSQLSLALSEQEVKHWQQDLDYYAHQLQQQHIDLYHSLPKYYFQQQLLLLKQQLPELSRNQVLVALMRLTSALQDSHTAFPLWGGSSVNSFPVRFSVIGQQFYVTSSSEAYQHLLGSQLVAIEGVPAQQLAVKLAPIVPFADNPYSTRHRIAEDLTTFEVLNGLGIAANQQAKFRFQHKNKELVVDLIASNNNDGREHQLSFFNSSDFIA